MLLANSTTLANGSERERIFPLLDKVKLKTKKRGRQLKRLYILCFFTMTFLQLKIKMQLIKCEVWA